MLNGSHWRSAAQRRWGWSVVALWAERQAMPAVPQWAAYAPSLSTTALHGEVKPTHEVCQFTVAQALKLK